MSAPTTRQWLQAAADRVSVGSGRLVTHYAGRALTAARARVGRWPGWLKASAAFVALTRGPQVLARLGDWAHERAASGAWAPGLATAAGLWVVAAYRAGHPDWKAAAAGESAEGKEEQPEPAEEEAPAAAPPARQESAPVSPVALVAAVRDIGTPHAQLKPLAEYLGTTTDAVRAAAAELEWPVKDVRMAGRSASAGLRWDECPSPPPLGPSPAVVGAGQPADDNDDDDTSGEGLRVEAIGLSGAIVRDPADAVRHHTVATK
ncbi:hypothetical protein [Streptomyces sp. BBFR109]|uniref:hypothetical protein n=1 Tax=Streptomyces sp. BBFR109 TaxID=3448172 RepID=UPI003F76FF07